jgi:excisionase family DNA binding protein
MHAVQGQSANFTTIPTSLFEPLLTDTQAAELLGIHPKTLQRFARGGQIPAHRIGRFWRYRASELDWWLRSELCSGSQSAA